jgi:hypothetical protein
MRFGQSAIFAIGGLRFGMLDRDRSAAFADIGCGTADVSTAARADHLVVDTPTRKENK